MQELITQEQRAQMIANGRDSAERIAIDGNTRDHKPVVKLFTPWGGCAWLLSELDPENPTLAFGLCDLGMGEPELGYVDLTEVEAVRGPGGIRIERDEFFTATDSLSHYAAEARRAGRILA